MPSLLSKRQKVAVAVTAVLATINIKKRKKRKIWVKEYLQLREKLSNMQILSVLEPGDLRNYLRVGAVQFEHLLSLVTPHIQKQDTVLRQSVTAKQRLVVTLRFLATGNSYQDLKYSTLISQPLLSQIIPETCRAIYKCLSHYIKMPTTETEWREVAEQFEQRWNFPHCVGSCDGKHVAIEKPHDSGSLFYNYKGFFSIVLFAVVNANYEFLYVNTGTNGSVADASILNCTRFYQKMINDDLNLPPPESAEALPGTDTVAPYVFLGDSAFALNKNFMKPFPFKNINYEQRIYNYRLSRARRVVENAFGILASRFRVLRRTLDVDLDTVDAIVMACCALHNYLRKHATAYIRPNNVDRENITSATFHEGDWRTTTDGFTPLQHRNNSQRSDEAVAVRDKFKNYFITEGRVGFQDRMINIVPV